MGVKNRCTFLFYYIIWDWRDCAVELIAFIFIFIFLAWTLSIKLFIGHNFAVFYQNLEWFNLCLFVVFKGVSRICYLHSITPRLVAYKVFQVLSSILLLKVKSGVVNVLLICMLQQTSYLMHLKCSKPRLVSSSIQSANRLLNFRKLDTGIVVGEALKEEIMFQFLSGVCMGRTRG